MRPKAKFLTVVWGEAYIKRFASLSLPSFLAPGNLPALAEATELEVVIMTRRDDIEYFETQPAFHRLRMICPVRFVEIDDLITTSAYGVTLTLAYTRAVVACGPEMLETHFVFMNADFVLADGSLRALTKHILAGRSIVLGPSFRATAEAVEPLLEAALDSSSSVLAVPPRQLAALSLPHPHPTTVAKIVNQGFCHSTHPNQFFWQVDDQTVLGRYYLIFMLCLKPERILETINCYCDYAFIPELCPSANEVAMDDSDDFFMLELQKHDQEMHMLQVGGQSEQQVVRSLQEWTTAEHRRAAHFDIVFHAGEIPAEIASAKDDARAFVERIEKDLGRPVSHVDHRYWVRGVAAWRILRGAQSLPGSPPELTGKRGEIGYGVSLHGVRSRLVKWLWSAMYASHHATMGLVPRVTPLHPDWADYQFLESTVATILSERGASVLVVRDHPEVVDSFISPDARVRFVSVKQVLTGDLLPRGLSPRVYSHALIYLRSADCSRVQALLGRCEAAMEPEGCCQVFIQHLGADATYVNLSDKLIWYVDSIIGSPPREVACTFVGGTLKRFSRNLLSSLYSHYANFGIPALLWVMPSLLAALPLVALVNLYLHLKGPTSHFVPFCSSVAIRFTPTKHAAPVSKRDVAQRA